MTRSGAPVSIDQRRRGAIHLPSTPDAAPREGLAGDDVIDAPVDSRAADAELFAALANPDRLEMLSALLHASAEGKRLPGVAISQLAAAVEISRFAASRHLAILRRVGLVDVQLQGRRALHFLSASRFELLEDWLYPFVAQTQTQDPARRGSASP